MEKRFYILKMTLSLILNKEGKLGDGIELGKYNKVRTDTLIGMLEKVKPCDGYVLVANIDMEESTYTEGKYVFKDDELTFEECSIKITVRESAKNKTKSFSQREKLDLLLEYIRLNHAVPKEETIYKECQIGRFMMNVDKWTDICDIVKEAKPDTK